MSLKYTCLGCGTPLGYEGLCWKCECEKSRKTALGWMPEQIAEKQKNLIQNIQRLADMLPGCHYPGDPTGSTGCRGILSLRTLLRSTG